MKIPNVKNAYENAVSRGREPLPAAPKAQARAQPEVGDGFSRPSVTELAARRLGGMPSVTLPNAQHVKEVFGEVRQAGSGAVSSARERVGDLVGDVKERVGDVKERVGDLVGNARERFDTFKDKAIHVVLDEAFRVLDALPGEIDQRALNRIMDLGGVKAPERALNAEERAILEPIFGEGLDYDAIRVRIGDIGLFNQNDRPLVIGNSILMPEGRLDKKTGEMRRDDLVHEALHNWQYQQGGIEYIKQSVQDQLTGGHGAYDISGALANRTPWNELRTEQQAVIIETAFEQGYFDTPGGGRVVLKGVDHTEYFEACIAEMRAGQGAPGGDGANHGVSGR